MPDEQVQHLGGHGGDVGSEPRRLHDVQRVPDTGDQDLGGETVVVVDLPDIRDQLHAGGGNVVEPADEGTHDVGARLRGEERLGNTETEGHVDADPLLLQRADRAQAVRRQRALDDDVRGDGRELPALGHHPGGIGRQDLRRDVARNQLGDRGEDFPGISRFLRHERRIRRDAIHESHRGGSGNLVNVRGVKKDLHARPAPCPGRNPARN